MVMICSPAVPPAFRQSFTLRKKIGQYFSPTASNISIEAMRS